MRNTLFLLPLLFVASSLQAQHQIVAGDGVLDVGETITYHRSDPSTFNSLKGTSGIDRTWDFSSLTSTGTIDVYGADSAGTPMNARSVPFATDVALRGIDRWVVWDDFTYCYNVTSNGVFMQGKYKDSGGSLGPWAIVSSHEYDNPDCAACEVEYYDFPASFGDAVNSQLQYSFSDDQGAVYYYSGEVDVDFDAYGTLTMPGGIVLNDVLRIEIKEDWDQMSNFGGMGTKLDDVDHITYEFRVKENKSAVIRYENWTGGSFHGTFGDREKLWYMDATSGALGLNTIHENLESVKLYPNPSHNQTHIAYNLNKPAQVEVKVLDINGRVIDVVFSGEQEADGYNLPYRLDQLDMGSYLVEVSIDGEKTTRKLMVR
jgi:hypothetical protein